MYVAFHASRKQSSFHKGRKPSHPAGMVSTKVLFVDVVGNVGVALILYAYFALALQRIESHSILYSALNLLGSLFICVSLYFDFNLPSAVIEVCWCLISVYGLTRAFRSSRQTPPHTPIPDPEQQPIAQPSVPAVAV